MTARLWGVVAIGVLAAIPLTGVQAACDTESARGNTQIRYAQAMATWQQNDAVAYEAAQDQLRIDAAVAKRGGAVKQCQFWEKTIRASHRSE